MFPKLDKDPEGRYWVQCNWNSTPVSEQQVVGFLVTVGDDGELFVLGNVFVIKDNNSTAICLTAAHSLEALKQLKSRSANSRNISNFFQPNLPSYVETNRVHVVFIVDLKPILCAIRQLNYIQGNDIAVLIIEANDHKDFFRRRLKLDLQGPKVGEQVGVLANSMSLSDKDAGSAILEQKLEMRLGTVFEAAGKSGRLSGQSFCFSTTIPVLGGMSGAPILRSPLEGQTSLVCGVVSSDISAAAAFQSFNEPGNSTGSAIWPSLALGVSLSIEGSTSRFYSILELCEIGIIDAELNGIHISVCHHEYTTDILYVDETCTPPIRILLTNTKHPNVPS